MPANGENSVIFNTFKRLFKTDLDIVGMYASTICAVHCLALPFLLVALPLAGITFVADLLWEIAFLGVAAIVGITGISRSFKIHRKKLPAILLMIGLLLLILSKIEISHGHEAIEAHTFIAFFGGIIVALAHFVNLRFKNTALAFKQQSAPDFTMIS